MKTSSELFAAYLPKIEAALSQYLPATADGDERNVLFQAMRYGVLDGGKRIRPVLVLAFCEAFGGDVTAAYPFACAIECIHSYSLIHDDLPCMDNDDFRRGKPSAHKAFGEANALLAGDGLLTYAFQLMLTEGQNSPACVSAAACLATEAGCCGMVGGQIIDLASEGKAGSLDLLKKMDDGKTVALIRAACKMGVYLSGHATAERLAIATAYAEGIGLAFQIQDDILDIESDDTTLGKPTGSDIENNKTTYVSVLGLDEAKNQVALLTEQAIAALKPLGADGLALADLAKMLGARRK